MQTGPYLLTELQQQEPSRPFPLPECKGLGIGKGQGPKQ